MKKRTKFIKENVDRLMAKRESMARYASFESCLRQAIELGMANHDLQDDTYSYTFDEDPNKHGCYSVGFYLNDMPHELPDWAMRFIVSTCERIVERLNNEN